MKGVIITERTVTEILRAIAVRRQAGHAESNETIDQLLTELQRTQAALRQTRFELEEARAEHAQMMADLQQHFDEEWLKCARCSATLALSWRNFRHAIKRHDEPTKKPQINSAHGQGTWRTLLWGFPSTGGWGDY